LPNAPIIKRFKFFKISVTYDGSKDFGYNISAPGSAYPGSTANEMAFMYYNNLGNIGQFDLDGNARSSGWGLVNTGPFVNIQSDQYWSSSTYPPDEAFQFFFDNGVQNGDSRSNIAAMSYAWAVRDGDVEPNTYCVSTADELLIALAEAAGNGQNDLIKVRQGTYNGNFVYSSTEAFSLTIEGGYKDPHCKKRVDPANTVFDAGGSGRVLTLDSSSEVTNFTVEGLTLQRGNITGANGGAMFIRGAYISLNNNIH
jgi:hypothetical protein